jgi:hypothetical protein
MIMTNEELVKEAKLMLDMVGIKYSRVYVYEGCTREMCGPMPRVIVCTEGDVPVCYSLKELAEKYLDKMWIRRAY